MCNLVLSLCENFKGKKIEIYYNSYNINFDPDKALINLTLIKLYIYIKCKIDLNLIKNLITDIFPHNIQLI